MLVIIVCHKNIANKIHIKQDLHNFSQNAKYGTCTNPWNMFVYFYLNLKIVKKKKSIQTTSGHYHWASAWEV